MERRKGWLRCLSGAAAIAAMAGLLVVFASPSDVWGADAGSKRVATQEKEKEKEKEKEHQNCRELLKRLKCGTPYAAPQCPHVIHECRGHD
jgi:hypothetical protein